MGAFEPGRTTDPNPRRREAFAGPMRATATAARDSFGRAVESLLAHRADTADSIDAALAVDPGLAPAHLLRGFALRVLGRRDLFPGIREALKSAWDSMEQRGGEPREKALFEALVFWMNGQAPLAAARLDRHLSNDPQDLLVIKLTHAIRFMMGDSWGMRRSLEAVLPLFGSSTPGYGFVLGCYAFALEETRDYREAERAGRQAIEFESQDVWGLHAVAHVYYERDQTADGLRWLRSHEPRLEGVNNFAGHIAWHEALFWVKRGAPSAALDLYDRRIAVYPPRDFRDVSNAASLLLLLEDSHLDVRERWSALAEVAEKRLGDHGLAFADLHYVLALAGAERLGDARRFIGAMKRAAESSPRDFDACVLRDVGIPLAEAVIGSRTGRWDEVHRLMHQVSKRTVHIGGSHAQRRVVDWLFLAETRQRLSSMEAEAQ